MYRVPIYRVQLVRDGSCKMAGRCCASPAEAAALFRELVGDADREHLVAMFLDVNNCFLGVQTVSIGDLNNTIAHPREVFKAAILTSASSLILAHNHPSGTCSPSNVDVRMTKEMVAVGHLIGIPVLDHLIVGEPGYVSLLMLDLVPGLGGDETWEEPEPQKEQPKRKSKKAERA
jgi:DNA repair protein RadC